MSWRDTISVFQPRRGLTNAHLQTIAGNYFRRSNSLPAPERHFVEVTAAHGSQIASQVLCECHWQPAAVRASRPTVIIVHGLEGSSNSQYVLGNANKLWRAGANIIRMNMRNCGGTGYEMTRLTPTLYHSGLSADVDRVMRFFLERESLQWISIIGYSMGGNMVLKLAGVLGAEAPPQLRSVVAVSPALDLAASADALHEPANRLYEWKFVRALLKRFRRKAELFPRAFDPQRTVGIKSIRDFDERITSLYAGFQSADDYYFRAAAARVLDKIAVPTLILHALDDPFVRITPESRALIAANACITMIETPHGGHCAFLAAPDPAHGNDGYWAEHTAVSFILANT